MHARTRWMVTGLLALAALTAAVATHRPADAWSEHELATLRSLAISALPPLPPDPTNRYADDPRAAELGHRLFFDTRLSADGKVSCATCHDPGRDFQDGLPLGVGTGTTTRRTMPIAGTAHSPWLFWDGRKDSQWSQALGPLESPVEHGGTRLQYAHVVARHYRDAYEAVFGPLPDLTGLPEHGGPVPDADRRAAWEALEPAQREAVTRVFVNLGKAIAAYERTLQFGASRFDRYVEQLSNGRPIPDGDDLTADEKAGLRLFIGKAQCINCHNGPLFTDNHFHNTGVPERPGLPGDAGRAAGAQQVLADAFNCLSPYSDADPSACAELAFMVTEGEELMRAFKPPTLRNATLRPPYMHAGQLATLDDVLAHYNRAPAAPEGHSELRPLRLSRKELTQLGAFLHTLETPISAPATFLSAPTDLTAAR